MKNKEIYKRNLPHIQPLGGIFFVTWNLKGAIPKARLKKLFNEYKRKFSKVANKEARNKTDKLAFVKFDNELQITKSNHFLKDERLAKIVADTLHFWDEKRIDLYAYCIMSNHVHAVFQVYEKDENGKEMYLHNIMESIKKFSARKCNAILNRTGKTFWQDESYDRVVRDSKELYRIILQRCLLKYSQ